jgi:hypothetical protein
MLQAPMETMPDAQFVLAHVGDNFRVWHRPDSRNTGAGEDVQPAVTASIGTALQQQMQVAQERHMGSAIIGQQDADAPQEGFEDESPDPAEQPEAAPNASGGRGRTSAAAAAAVVATTAAATAAAAAAAGRSKQQEGATLEELCVTAGSVLLGQYRSVQNALQPLGDSNAARQVLDALTAIQNTGVD